MAAEVKDEVLGDVSEPSSRPAVLEVHEPLAPPRTIASLPEPTKLGPPWEAKVLRALSSRS